MAIIRWEPFRMEDFPEIRLPKFGNDMAVDVFEEGKDVVAEINLPGLTEDEIEIDVEDNSLKISGNREDISEEKREYYYYQEIQRGSFERMVRLPVKVKPEESTADFENGLLRVIMPKAEEKRVNKIQIKPKPKTASIKKNKKTKTTKKK